MNQSAIIKPAPPWPGTFYPSAASDLSDPSDPSVPSYSAAVTEAFQDRAVTAAYQDRVDAKIEAIFAAMECGIAIVLPGNDAADIALDLGCKDIIDLGQHFSARISWLKDSKPIHLLFIPNL